VLPDDRLATYREQAAALMLLMANSQAQQAARLANDPARSDLLAQAAHWNRRAEITHPAGEQCRTIWAQRSFLARLNGDRVEADRFAQKAAGITLGAQDALLEGRRLMGEGRLAAAKEMLMLSTQSNPRQFWAWFHLGACRALLGQDGEAAAAYDICVSLEPGFFGTYFNRGQARLRLGQCADAESDFGRAIELQSEWADPYLLRALSREAQQNFPEAIADLNRALELGYTPTSVYLVRSRVHGRMKDKSASERDLAEGLKSVPTDERGWMARAQARLFSDPAAALADYDKAISLNPRCIPALQGRAHLLSRAGKNKEAVAALSKIIEINPDSADAWSGRGVLNARLNDRDAALADAREALRLTERPSTRYQVAGIYALTSRTQPDDRREALALLDGALRAGFGFEYLDKDRELDPIRKDADFQRTVDAARAYRNSLVKTD
jgi:tetratricopeptide (TPR) repeat protein